MATSFVKICKRYVKVGRKEGKLHGKFVLTVTVHRPFLMKMKIDPTGGYHYHDEVLEYIRAIAPRDIKGEIREQAYRVSLTEFCEALSIQKL